MLCESVAMESGRPSKTAFAAATHRAVHQIVDGGAVFRDPLAVPILGLSDGELRERAKGADEGRRMRWFIAMRSRYAEDALAAAVRDGSTQLVILGAGLDTFAYRNPFGAALRVFEVDFPATQDWKRTRLQEAKIAEPAWLTYSPVDFERETLADGLAATGFNPDAQTFFTWLGVVPYLSRYAIFKTLSYIARLPGGAQVVFDYSDPPETMDNETRAWHDKRALRVAEAGEQWVSYFEPAALRGELLKLNFLEVEDLRTGQLVNRFFPLRGNAVARRGGHVIRAWTR
jgi:methyltransferase (TIGR00027 family)